MSENLTISLRSIQHYMYCPRRYALLELNRDWNENAFVVKAKSRPAWARELKSMWSTSAAL